MRVFVMVTFLVASGSLALRAADAKSGELVYSKHCKTCHGPNGAAPPNVAKFENGHIMDLRSSKV